MSRVEQVTGVSVQDLLASFLRSLRAEKKVTAILWVHDREGYWLVECGACDYSWQVPCNVAAA